MDGGQITAIVIVALVMLGSIIRAGIRGPRHAPLFSNPQGEAENQRLRDEVRELKERIKVIERITVEKENSLAKEIESLRDR
ncbi:MAG TPA: hypothetical protein VNS11_04320 [Sphingomicrobium sp.]|nr:hypothetical protein [Sphingomicrobium sp.]